MVRRRGWQASRSARRGERLWPGGYDGWRTVLSATLPGAQRCGLQLWTSFDERRGARFPLAGYRKLPDSAEFVLSGLALSPPARDAPDDVPGGFVDGAFSNTCTCTCTCTTV